MEKKTLLKIGQGVCLAAFAGFAMACGCSTHDAIKGVDDFVDGYNQGKSLWSETNFEEGDIPTSEEDMAYQEIPTGRNAESKENN